MTEKELLERFISYCNKESYGSAYSQSDLILNFLDGFHKEFVPTVWKTRAAEGTIPEELLKADTEQAMQRYSNMHLFFYVINEFSDPTEIYLVSRTDRKIVGRLVTDIGEDI